MSLPVVLTPAAQADFDEAADYYEHQATWEAPSPAMLARSCGVSPKCRPSIKSFMRTSGAAWSGGFLTASSTALNRIVLS